MADSATDRENSHTTEGPGISITSCLETNLDPQEQSTETSSSTPRLSPEEVLLKKRISPKAKKRDSNRTPREGRSGRERPPRSLTSSDPPSPLQKTKSLTLRLPLRDPKESFNSSSLSPQSSSPEEFPNHSKLFEEKYPTLFNEQLSPSPRFSPSLSPDRSPRRRSPKTPESPSSLEEISSIYEAEEESNLHPLSLSSRGVLGELKFGSFNESDHTMVSRSRSDPLARRTGSLGRPKFGTQSDPQIVVRRKTGTEPCERTPRQFSSLEAVVEAKEEDEREKKPERPIHQGKTIILKPKAKPKPVSPSPIRQ